MRLGDGYTFAIALSLLAVLWPPLVWPVLTGWLVWAVRRWVLDGRSSLPVWALVGGCLLRQLPGVGAGILCVLPWAQPWQEAAGGLLAIWVHPWMPVLERLFPGLWHGLSDAFWAAAVLPLCVVMLSCTMTLTSRWVHRRRARRPDGPAPVGGGT
ncbi:hypothetical protein [Alicyclobacillus sp.]|uniref:hypothetical protein n=1 Tax=Alicyclobacillus sp. TaxID=61169 RepID=UPI0025BA5215|nr:hypothetical protein [Alicyclobacillus sp.]MCL6517589.1 hypothetical protein [Alicyclobacillus sp.]